MQSTGVNDADGQSRAAPGVPWVGPNSDNNILCEMPPMCMVLNLGGGWSQNEVASRDVQKRCKVMAYAQAPEGSDNEPQVFVPSENPKSRGVLPLG